MEQDKRIMENPIWIRVAAALIQREGRYLITQRKPDVHMGGMWEFPGGKCEPNETLEACLRRELLEELEIAITSPAHFLTHRYAYSDKNIELHFFHCAIESGVPRPVGCVDYCWVHPREFARYPFPPADEVVVAELCLKSDV